MNPLQLTEFHFFVCEDDFEIVCPHFLNASYALSMKKYHFITVQ